LSQPKPEPALKEGGRGQRFYRAVADAYEASVDELEILAEACSVLDRLDELHALVDHDGLMVPGSKGQDVLHPAIGEARRQQALLASLCRRLSLEVPGREQGGDVASITSARARKAARARWDNRGAR